MQIERYSENTVTLSFGDDMDEGVNRQLVQLKNILDDEEIDGITEIVISYTSLIVYFDCLKVTGDEITQIIKGVDMEELAEQSFEYKVVEIPVCYGGDYGPDLNLFEENGLSLEEVIDIHSDTEYLVYMLGFMPGFPYLGGLDERLFKARLDNPRKSIPAGSVGIGGKQTGMYPFVSPGGWNLLGRTPIPLFDAEREPQILYEAGDRIIYKSIDEDEFKCLEAQIEAGDYEVTTRHEEAIR